jgi:hypothetical protein
LGVMKKDFTRIGTFFQQEKQCIIEDRYAVF